MSARRVGWIVVVTGLVLLALGLLLRTAQRSEDKNREASSAGSNAERIERAPRLVGQAGAAGAPSEIAVTDAAGIRGRLIDRTTGKPVAGARVQAFAYATGERATGVTDDDGAYAFPDLDPREGVAAIAVDTEHHGRALRAITVPGEPAGDLSLDMGGWIEGRVTDHEGAVPPEVTILTLERPSGRPVATSVHEPLVRLALPTDLTESSTRHGLDAEGRFRIGPLAPGLYGLLILRPGGPPHLALAGGKTYERGAGYAVEAARATDAGTISLAPLGHALVRVLDAATDEPLAGATFTYEAQLDHRARGIPASAVEQQADGSYAVPLALEAGRPVLGYHHLRTHCDGYIAGTLSFGYQANGSVFTLRLLRASALATLHGRILDELGQAIPSALVLLRGEADQVGQVTSTSDAQGRYRLEGIRPDLPVEVVVLAPHLQNVLSVVTQTLSPGEVRALDLGGPTTTALLVEVRHRGMPLENAFLSLDTTDGRRTQFHSGPDGRVRFDGIPPGTHELFLSVLEERAMQTRPVTVEEGSPTRLEVDFRHAVEGTFEFQDAEGNPKEVEAYFNLAVRRVDVDDGVVTEGPVAKDGRFAFLLSAPGVYRLEPSDWVDPVDLVASPNFEVIEGEPTGDLHVVWRMQAMDGRIEIAVKSAEDGEPIEEGDYDYRWRTTQGAALFNGGRILDEARGLGEHTYVVSADAFAPETLTVTLTEDQKSIQSEVRLRRSNGVRLTEFTADSRLKAAGLRRGDVLLHYGETRVLHVGALREVLRATTPQDTIRLTLWRAGSRVQIDAPGGRMGAYLRNARVKAE